MARFSPNLQSAMDGDVVGRHDPGGYWAVSRARTRCTQPGAVISNTATIDAGSVRTLKRSAVIFANGNALYMPVILK